MKRLLISVLIFSVAVLICFTGYIYVENRAVKLTELLDKTNIEISKNNTEAINTCTEETVAFWKIIEPTYRALIDGETCNKLDEEVYSIQFSVIKASYSDAEIHINNCLIILKQISDSEKLSIEAIL